MVLIEPVTICAETAGFAPISEGHSRFNTSPGGHPFDMSSFLKDKESDQRSLAGAGPQGGTQIGERRQPRYQAFCRGVQHQRCPTSLTSGRDQSCSGSVVQSARGPGQLLYRLFRAHKGRSRGEHYAIPHSPRSSRESTTGHTSIGSVCTTYACSVCVPCLVVHPPALVAYTQPSATRDARH